MDTFEIRHTCATKESLDFVDITDDVREAVGASGVKGGRVTVFSPAPGCSILANERESGLLRDIRRAVAKLEASGGQRGSLHIGSSSVVFPVVEGDLRLGTWQRILLVELEGPRERTILIQTVGE
jgi:secondary thiamine-phosphate synthase enzyme